ncbi:PAS domain S-box protein [Candidatus Omnitrophota bacterium]
MKYRNGTIEHLMNELAEMHKRVMLSESPAIRSKKIEAALKESEEKYRTLFENVNIGVYRNTGGAHGRFLHANPAIVKMFGYDSIEEFMKTPVSALYQNPEERKLFTEKVLRDGFVKNKELRLRKKDGTPIWASVTANVQYDKNGSIKWIDGVVEDITESKHEKEQILLANERLEYLLFTTSAVIYTAKASGDYGATFISENVIRLTGYKSRDFVENPSFWIEHVHPEDVPRVLTEVRNVLKKEKYTYEYRFKHKDGRFIWMRDEMKLVRDKKSRPLEIIGFWADITERKKMEEELRKLVHEKSIVLDNTGEIIAFHDIDRNIQWANKAYLKATGLLLSDIRGQKCYQAWGLDRFCCNCPVTKVIETGEPQEAELTPQNQGYWPSDQGSWLSRAAPVKDDTGSIIGAIEVAYDITKRKKAEETLKESEQRYRAIFAQAADSIVLIDVKTGALVEFNDKAHQNLGYTRSEFEKLKMPDFEIIESEEEVKKHIKKIVREGSDVFETKQRRKNGEIRNILVSSSAISFGKKSFIQTIWCDITERKKAEENLNRLNMEISRSNRKLQRLALKDPQTGLCNHRYFEEIIESEFHRAKRYSSPLSLIMLDIDYFKSINDVYGHRFGDLVLKQFAKKARRLVRLHDHVIRFGGEEFVIILPRSNRADTLAIAQRLSDSIKTYKFGDKVNVVTLRLSTAVVSYPEDAVYKCEDFIELADTILNKIKEYGGDKVYSFIDMQKKGLYPDKGYNNANIKYLKEKLSRLTRRSNQSLIESIFAFARTIEVKDHYTGSHVEKTVYYATSVSRKLGLSNAEVVLIEQAAILHDLGKIGISEKILLKKGKLTKREFEKIKQHPKIGVGIIRPVQFLHGLIPLILHHHERWDGRGYPDGLKGREIPLGARIIAIADVYHALISKRPYRKALSAGKAIRIIKESSGTQFDPKIANVFLKILQTKNTLK